MSYKKSWKHIIRPPKCEYKIDDLGDKKFKMQGKFYYRTDLEFLSIKGEKILGSHFEPDEANRVSPILPCVIYVHGNAGCRLDALNYTFVLTGNMTLFTFDFPGCGMSEGKYISLGWFEQHDLENIIEFIRYNRRVGKIALWGRSMGAVTSILYCSNNPNKIQALVLDSPFCKFKKLAMDIAKAHVSYLPGFLLSIAYKYIRHKIKKKIGADIQELKPAKVANKFEIPTFFIYSSEDELIPSDHFAYVQSNLRNIKEVRVLDGPHNDIRSLKILREIGLFLCRELGVHNLAQEPQHIPSYMISSDTEEQIRKFEEFSNSKNDYIEMFEQNLSRNAEMYYRTIPTLDESN